MSVRCLALCIAGLAIACKGDAKGRDSAAARADSSRAAPAPAIGGDTSRALGATGASTGVARAAGGSESSPSATRGAPTRPTKSSAARRTTRPRAAADTAGAGASGDSGVTRSAAADSARGIVAVVGTSFDSRVVVRPAGGGRPVTLGGAQARTVARLAGADVWVSGTRDENGRLRVSRFVVRGVDGNPALDGTLIARGDRLLVVTRDGKQHAIENPPATLRDHVGARVWVAGPLEKGPITYGIIEERR